MLNIINNWSCSPIQSKPRLGIFRKTPKIKDNGDAIVYVFLVADSLLGSHSLHNLEVMDRGKPEFEPIVKDPKKGARQYFCVECGNVAAQTALFKIVDAVLVERYCDGCASKKK